MSEHENYLVVFPPIHRATLGEIYDYLKECGYVDSVKKAIIHCYGLLQEKQHPDNAAARTPSVLIDAKEEDVREFFIHVFHEMHTGEGDGPLYKEMLGETLLETTLLSMKLTSKE